MHKIFSEEFDVECSKTADKNQYILNKEKRAEKYKKKRNDSDYFIYKFVDDCNRIIYIGKTIRLPDRMVQHFTTDSHLADECYDHVKYIFYSSLKTKIEMDIYEIYLIDKYRPQHNIKSVYKQDEISNIVLPELVWEKYYNKSLDLKEKSAVPNKKSAIVIDDIHLMIEGLGLSLTDTRDRALLLIGFAGAFRRSELVAITMDDIEFNHDGLTIVMQNSETGQDGQRGKKNIPYGSHHETCPIRSLQDWLSRSKITEGAIFRSVNKSGKIGKKGLCDHMVAVIVKKLAKAAGLDERNYSGHSLRSGLITEAVNRVI